MFRCFNGCSTNLYTFIDDARVHQLTFQAQEIGQSLIYAVFSFTLHELSFHVLVVVRITNATKV